jgi:tetratricopeptide (TPR) repeat protein
MQEPAEVPTRVERLLRDAHIQRLRRQWSAAETLCRQALELAPDDVMGLEMLGDLLLDKGSTDDALDSYRKAFERQPKASLEEKIARAVLVKGEEERARLEAQVLLNSPFSKAERKRNATLAVLCSVLCPGLGQMVLGQYQKGALLAGSGVLALFFGSTELAKFMFGLMGAPLRGEPVNGALAMLGMLGILVYIYSLLDASAQAGKVKQPPIDV